MILYSIIPPEVVFQGGKDSNDAGTLEAAYRGERVIVAKGADDQFTITRLISTCPKAYLDPALQPGKIVNRQELSF